MKSLITIIILIIVNVGIFAQPTPDTYYFVEQKDSLYYLVTNKGLFKFYSNEQSSEFFLTRFVENNFPSYTKLTLNDSYLLTAIHDSLFYYRNSDPYDLTFENVYYPGFPIRSIHGFGPFFFIRSINTYKLIKIENGYVEVVEDSLFTHPNQLLVHFTYPYVIIGFSVYKYTIGSDFTVVFNQVGCGNTKTDLSGNELICHFYWQEPLPYPGQTYCNLYKRVIEEPSFPFFTYTNWGINIPQIHTLSGNLIAKKNLCYFYDFSKIILTSTANIAYIPNASDIISVSDYYIFKLGDSLKYSKWNTGSTFNPLTWVDLTSVRYNDDLPKKYALSQNYPNPFNPSTKIRYEIPSVISSEGRNLNITLKVYDVLGNEVATLVDEFRPAGIYEIEFNVAQDSRPVITSGVYFYQLKAGNYIETKKMILIK